MRLKNPQLQFPLNAPKFNDFSIGQNNDDVCLEGKLIYPSSVTLCDNKSRNEERQGTKGRKGSMVSGQGANS